jgi:sugar phosphate isomerase/epimerase
MFFSGFADEAAGDIDGQIEAIQELGWDRIELRQLNGRPVHDLPPEEIEHVATRLEAAGIRANAIGSTIANWSRSILAPMDDSVAEARRCIALMKRLGCPQVRIMSFAILRDRPPDRQEVRERVRRLRELTRLFSDAGLEALHENCENYGGMGSVFTRELLDGVPGLRLVFDTANPATMADRSQPPPHPRQSSWKFYREVRDRIAHVHIKDGIFIRESAEAGAVFPEARYTWPGEGHGDILRILMDLIATGYDGGFSIEPHLRSVFHAPNAAGPGSDAREVFVDYGRRFMALHHEAVLRSPAPAPTMHKQSRIT